MLARWAGNDDLDALSILKFVANWAVGGWYALIIAVLVLADWAIRGGVDTLLLSLAPGEWRLALVTWDTLTRRGVHGLSGWADNISGLASSIRSKSGVWWALA